MNSLNALSGKCRVCGCTEFAPCQLETGHPCAWLDSDCTLCTNLRCVAALPIEDLLELVYMPAALPLVSL